MQEEQTSQACCPLHCWPHVLPRMTSTCCVYTTASAWVLLHRFYLLLQDHKKNTLTPVWNERKWLMVQEPQTQDLRIEVFDWDRINVKELLTINLLKGLKDTMGSKTLMGRSASPPCPCILHGPVTHISCCMVADVHMLGVALNPRRYVHLERPNLVWVWSELMGCKKLDCTFLQSSQRLTQSLCLWQLLARG